MTYKEQIYDSYRSSFKGQASRESLAFGSEKILECLKPWVTGLDRSTLAVDLGCGAGELLRALSMLGFTNLGGCDLSGEQIAVARQSFNNVEEANLFDYLERQEDASVGLITVFDVIEHLGPQATFDFMKLAHSKLTPGGRLIAHTPNGFSPFVGHVLWSDMTHEWCLTPKSARTLCSIHGFVDFEAAEHLGASDNWSGKLRGIAWRGVRLLFKSINCIETGATGGSIWTRNFAFTTRRAKFESRK